jgi:hypothetical protein
LTGSSDNLALGPKHLQSVLTLSKSNAHSKKEQDKVDTEIQREKINVLINLYDTSSSSPQKQGTITLNDFVQKTAPKLNKPLE